MSALLYLFELFVGLLAVLGIAATLWFIGAYLIIAIIVLTLLFMIWGFGHSIAKVTK